jgi:hypothetical protein
MTPGGLLDQGMFEAVRNVVNAEHIDRLAKPSSRGWIFAQAAWAQRSRSLPRPRGGIVRVAAMAA